MGSTVKKSKSVPFNTGTVIYPATETGASTGVTVAPRADDTMIETYTIIHEASAPEEYRFRMALGPGERLVSTGENSAIVDADGITMTTIDAPWAVDAVGRPVPFSLSVEGSDIVMTVRHQQPNFAYPIVADPGFQIDCGFITCSIYFSRSVTRDLGEPIDVATWLNTVECDVRTGLSLLPALAGPVGVGATAVALGANEALCDMNEANLDRIRTKAEQCASRNQCLRVRIPGGILFMYCDGGRFCQN